MLFGFSLLRNHDVDFSMRRTLLQHIEVQSYYHLMRSKEYDTFIGHREHFTVVMLHTYVKLGNICSFAYKMKK